MNCMKNYSQLTSTQFATVRSESITTLGLKLSYIQEYIRPGAELVPGVQVMRLLYMNSVPPLSFGCVTTAFLWVNECRLNRMAIDDRLRPDFNQNFCRSLEIF